MVSKGFPNVITSGRQYNIGLSQGRKAPSGRRIIRAYSPYTVVLYKKETDGRGCVDKVKDLLMSSHLSRVVVVAY